MSLDYESIFLHRGNNYNLAMTLYPRARDNEFNAVIDVISQHLKPNTTLLDIPSGNQYFKSYLPNNINYGLEVTQFTPDISSQIVSWTSIPYPDNYMDIIICLAAHHHLDITQRSDFYKEAFRILKPNGLFVIGDVKSGSKIDPFLNIFVDKYNGLGHKGIFLCDKDLDNIQNVGFNNVTITTKSYPWIFDNLDVAIHYVKLLFDLDLANSEDIKKEVDFTISPSHIELPWELSFITAIKN
jgi:SAM-dependent methyltransferase